MSLQKIEDYKVHRKSIVKVTTMGNITEKMYLSRRNTKPTVQKLPNGKMLVLSTGEVKDIKQMEKRVECANSLRKSMRNLRNILNANITDVSKCRWVTLTYAENMTDTKRLYADFKKFIMRFKYYSEKEKLGKFEYIVAMEPQGRGAWHAHLVLIFENKAPFIPNDVLWRIWSPKGIDINEDFVTIKRLDDVDNVGAYLTAYLGDMDIQDVKGIDVIGKEVKEVEITENGEKKKKYYVKGARLNLYPANFNLYRCSRGIKKPIEEYMTEEQARKKVSAATLTYDSTHLYTSNEGFECVIDKKYYNSKRTKKQEIEEKEKDTSETGMFGDMKPTFMDELKYAKGRYGWKPMFDLETGEIYPTPFDSDQ